MGKSFRDRLALGLVAALCAGCAATETAAPKEGQVVFQAGTPPPSPSEATIVPGEAIRRPAVLVPATDPPWKAGWLEADRKKSGAGGAYSGLMTGLMIVQSVPFFMGFWPAAVGVVVGTTAVGALGGQLESTSFEKMAADDQAMILQAIADLRLDHLLRESVTGAVAARTRLPPLSVLWYPTWGPDARGTDPLAEARQQGADGVLNVSLEAFGLAKGEETDTYGVFVRVRAQLVQVTRGIRYDRVFEHGPGRPLGGLPRPAAYTLEFLAMDQAHVFRHEMQDVITRMARVVAEDPALPLAR